MLGLICIIAFSLLVKAIGQRSIAREAEGHPSLRACLVDAALLWATWVLLLTELLSLAYLLQFAAVLTAWIATCGVLIFLVRRGLGSGVGSDRSGKHSAEIHAKPLSFPLGLPRDALSIGIIAASLIFIAVAGIMAVFSPPNDPDTLSYHLSRQIYWLQQGSLDHFRTSNDRQIMMPPLAEIIGMHFMLLSGGDSWANLPQWFAYLLAGSCASLIARDLGAGRRGQLLAAFFVFTIPTAFHQASNAKNDLILGFFLLALSWRAINFARRPETLGTSKWQWTLVGLNLGLVWMTKGTGLLYGIPPMLWIGIVLLKQMRVQACKPIAIISLLGSLLSIGHYHRNYSWYGSPFGNSEKEGYDLVNETVSPGALVSNALRNVAMHLGTPNAALNEMTEHTVRRMHAALGLDPDDPATTYWEEAFDVFYYPRVETRASAPIHVLMLFALPLAALLFRLKLSRIQWGYCFLPLGCFLLFSVVVKWQPWHPRLHLPFLCLVAPLAAIVLPHFKRPRLTCLVGAGLALIAAVPALASKNRPVFHPKNIFNQDRVETLFSSQAHLRNAHLEMYDLIEKLRPSCIRFLLQWDFQYFLQQKLLDHWDQPPHFWGQVRPFRSPPPDMIVMLSGGLSELYLKYEDAFDYVEEWFQAVGETAPYTIYATGSLIRNAGLANEIPRFVGWHEESGLQNVNVYPALYGQAPYRQASGAATHLTFRAHSSAMLLRVSYFVRGRFGHPMIILFNERELLRMPLPDDGSDRRLALPFNARIGDNQLEQLSFIYPGDGSALDGSRSVFFTRLQIVEASRLASSSSKQSQVETELSEAKPGHSEEYPTMPKP